MKKNTPNNTGMRDYLKTTALLMGLLLTSNSVLAQGPVQPEAMQFEPVDVTDVVNLATGDFVYTIPLMSVPGPEGDYPIVLSYHSGIGPNQPATWVGLGWTLNPGAINRTLSGYPDDYKGDVVKTHYQADAQTSWALSLGAGWGPIGINMNYDHYSGMVGVNGMISVNMVKFGDSNLGGGIGADISFGSNGFSANASLSGSRVYGQSAIGSANLNVGTSGISAGANGSLLLSKNAIGSASLNASSSGVRRSVSGSLKTRMGSIGASINSSGGGGNFNVGGVGFSTVTSASNGNFSSSSRSVKIPLPGDFWVSIGFAKWKWTLDETFTEYSYGVLHQFENASLNNVKNERQASEEQLFPSKDAYQVTAQGISGSFAPVFDYPYLLEDGLDNDEKGKLSQTYGSNNFNSNNYSSNGVKFRFLDDTGLNFTNKQSLITTNNFSQIDASEFSGKKITPHISSVSGKIQGFTVISTDGMVYEFRLPVHNLYQYSETKFNDGSSNLLNWNSLNAAFATSWLLTEIKGPDFIDRDSDGEASDDDWGYWVKFNYDRISAPQIWRAPFVGYAQGNTEDTENFSMGVREVYYLESIETQTHKIEFTTGTSKNGNNADVNLSTIDDKINVKDRSNEIQNNEIIFEFSGNYEWVETEASSSESILAVRDYVKAPGGNRPTDGSYQTCGFNLRSFTKNDVDFSFNSSTGVTSVTVSAITPCTGYTYYDSEATILVSNFIDQTSSTHRKLENVKLFNKSNLLNEISKVSFEYDYSLREETPSSTSTIGVDGFNKGTLTLKELHFYGQNDFLVSPPYRFTYAKGAAPGTPLNPDFNAGHYDFWGSYRYITGSIQRNTSQVKGEADLAAAWSLTTIQTPIGSEIEIEYESDDFFRINNTYFLTDAKAYYIIAGSSSGNDIELSSSFSSSDFNNYNAGIIVEKHTYDENPTQNDEFRNPTETVSDYKTIGLFHIEAVDDVNSEITLDGTPVFKTSDIDNLYSYTFIAVPTTIYGGGTRVKSIKTQDGNEVTQTLYTYKDGNASSGVTASMPADYIELEADAQVATNADMRELYQSVFMDHKASYGRPNPGVIYSKVQVLNLNENLEPVSGMTEYEFYTAKDFPYEPDYSENHFYVIDNSGIYGKPKSVAYFEQYQDNSATKFRPLKRTETLYAYSDELLDVANVYTGENTQENSPNKPLGVTQQKHVSRVEKDGGGFFDKGIEHTYLNVFGTGQTDTEYFYNSTTSGTPSSLLISKGKTIGYDAYSGTPIVSVQQSSTNDEVTISKTTPAWWKYSGMKTKNMLTQSFQQTTYKSDFDFGDVDIDADLKAYNFPNSDVLSSSITTWSDTWPGISYSIWRKNDSYSFIADSIYQAFPEDSLGVTTNSYPAVTTSFPWKKTSNIVSYDEYGHAIETTNEDGTFQSVIYDAQNFSLVKAVISNARLNEIKYIDYEDNLGAGSSNARTGRKYGSQLDGIIATSPTNTPLFGGGYKVGIWYRSSGTGDINGVNIPATLGSDWGFIQIKASAGENIIAYDPIDVDDITIIPEYASISYFAYDPLTWKVTAMTGPDHRTSFYEYDDGGRLIGVRDQDKNLLQTNEYVYGQEHYISTDEVYYDPDETINFSLLALKSGISVNGDYKWSFGDGIGIETSSTAPSHSYSEPGKYNVSVAFTDNNNITRRTTRIIKVTGGLSAQLTILRTAFYGDSDEGFTEVEEPTGVGEAFIRVYAKASVTGGTEPYTYVWYKRPNSGSAWSLINNASSDMLNVGQATSGSSGSVDIRLVVTDYDNNQYEVIETIYNVE
ncbi:MAG: PKD domain-containing protein [Balneola sp.]